MASRDPGPETTVATFWWPAGIDELAEGIGAALGEVDMACGRPGALGPGVRVEVRVRGRSIGVVIGPEPDDGRWFVSVGRSVMSVERLIGIRRDHRRDELVAALDGILRDEAGVRDLRWLTEEAWAAGRQ